MSKPTLPTRQPLSNAASHLIRRISELIRRCRNLEVEETRLDTQIRVLNERLQKSKSKPPVSPIRHTISIPSLRQGTSNTKHTGDGDIHSTPPHIDSLKNIETPVKTFLLRESFALAMSAKSKRKGRIFVTGDSTEFGERKWSTEAPV